jgi:hypothetical protein
MRTEAARVLLLILTLLMLVPATIPGCAGETSGSFDVKRDHEAINRILSAAVLSDQPDREFRKALTSVRSFPSVDSAWTDGTSFFVRYRKGGTVTWTAPPEPNTENHH